MRKVITLIILGLGFSGANAAEITPDSEGNKKVVEALIDAGSDPNKEHPLEHHFYSYSSEALEKLLLKGESLGYRIANVGEGEYEGTPYWYGDLVKDTKLDKSVINKDNSLMLKLAKEFNAEYDGWGTKVVR